MQSVLMFLAAVLFFMLSCKPAGPLLQASRPNIVLIFADDLGYRDLACYGQGLIHTPNLDRMASEGVRFTSFYSASPVCAPSRCNLMMGRHAGHASIRSNMNITPPSQMPIADEEITMAEVLKEAGYATGAMGKWSLGAPGNSGNPLTQGFDYYYGYYCQCLAHNYYPNKIWRNDQEISLPNDTVQVHVPWCPYPLSYSTRKKVYSADLIADEALAFIDRNSDNPFFLYLPVTLPHSNGEAPEDERFEIPDWGVYRDKEWSPLEKGYAAMVTLLDKQVGDILEKLREHDIAKNTLVIFTSDNGPTKFAKVFYEDFDLRGRKRDLYEGGIRVPFIAWWPEKIPAGIETDYQATTYDLLATLCDLTGAPVPENTDGQSILPVLRGEEIPSRDFMYFEFFEGERSPKQAVIQGDWKLHRFRFDSEDASELELYNLNQDPQETSNVIAGHAEIAEKLLAILEREHTEYQYKDVKK